MKITQCTSRDSQFGVWSNLRCYLKFNRSVCAYINLKITYRISDNSCGCLISPTWICRSNRTYSFFYLFIYLFIFRLLSSSLIGFYYFNVTTLSKVINNQIKQNFPRFGVFKFGCRAKLKTQKPRKFFILF